MSTLTRRAHAFGAVLGAVATKQARQIWSMLAHEFACAPYVCVNRPMLMQRADRPRENLPD